MLKAQSFLILIDFIDVMMMMIKQKDGLQSEKTDQVKDYKNKGFREQRRG